MNKNNLLKLNIIFIVILVLFSLCSFFFDKYTNGLVSYIDSNEKINYSKDYFSTGSDDDLIIFLGTIFFVPLIIRVFRLTKKISLIEVIFISLLWSGLLFALIFGIEIGNIFLTLYSMKNALFIFWLFLFFIIPPYVIFSTIIVAFWHKQKKTKDKSCTKQCAVALAR